MRKRRTTIVVLAATKGGVGKTTLASALAVRAAQESKRVALIDLDPQESLASWWDRRGKGANPKLFETEGGSSEAIELLVSQGWEWVFIDTPPGALKFTEPAIAAADFVLIPTRASALDVEAIDAVVEICRERGKPFAFVINHAHPTWKITKTTVAYLREAGHVVCDQLISYRMAYIAAMTVGKSGPEVDKDGAAGKEIDGLWKEIKTAAAALPKAA